MENEFNPKKKPRWLFQPKPDILKCIICQQITDQPTSSTENGRTKLKEAASIRNDAISERLATLTSENFVYHISNSCYKAYTHKKSLDKIVSDVNKSNSDENNNNTVTCNSDENNNLKVNTKLQRSVSKSRLGINAPRVNPETKPCVICANIECKGDYKRYRISECDRAKKFLESAVYFQDEIYTRVCDLQDEHSVFGADLLYHSNCMRKYLRLYEYENSKTDKSNKSRKTEVFSEIIRGIDAKLLSGETLAVSDLREIANRHIANSDKQFRNREIRLLLINHYGPCIIFSEARGSASTVFYLEGKHRALKDEKISDEHDSIDKCAEVIRNALVRCDFKLNDKFCDAADLKDSWEATEIPESLLRFLGVLFNFDPSSFYTHVNDGETDSASNSMPLQRKMKMEAIFQILYYNVHNGTRRTPLHLMNSQVIHDKCKSRELITSFNHYGLSVSYNELQRYHNDMASLIIESSNGKVPLPSMFDTDNFTIAAFDNFDHDEATLSGIGGSHDTVSVLYQDKPTITKKKPDISETSVTPGMKVLQEQLECQVIMEYAKPVMRPSLSSNYSTSMEILSADHLKQAVALQEIAWSLARLDLSDINHEVVSPVTCSQKVPSWSAFNSLTTDENIGEMIVGFLPVLPYPVTEHRTVYTALKNFQSVLHDLRQTKLAITCDEGVYHIAREITMARPDEFQDIVLMLGTFHMTKIFLGCIGKYLRNSGAETILVENAVFGPNVVQSVLTGGNYVRSFKGIMLLGESLERLLWVEFFKHSNMTKYAADFEILAKLQDAIAMKDRDKSKLLLTEFQANAESVQEDFDTFVQQRCNQNETFKYWHGFIDLVSLLKNLVRADREGNWHLHLATVQDILPYFAVFDCVNYLRWCSVYLEDMKQLPDTAPEIYESFLEGKFVVKRTPGKFKAVAADQCLEQTINRSQKSSGGIIGSTRKKNYVAQWEIIYHEMMAVSSLHREKSGSKPFYHELTVNHEFKALETNARESNITDMVRYIQLNDNPFSTESEEVKLHNIINQQIMTEEIRHSILHVDTKGKEMYIEFRMERLIKKNRLLFDTIHRLNLKGFQSIDEPQTKSSLKVKRKMNDSAAGFRLLDICQARGYSTKELFKYDLVTTSYLFDEEGLMTKPVKYMLVNELEKTLEPEHRGTSPTSWQNKQTAYIVDVMANIRKLKLSGLKTFNDFCAAFARSVLYISKTATRIDFVFDSYIEGSIKDNERSRRSRHRPVEVSSLKEDTPLPVNMDTFWASSSNKVKLQNLLMKWIRKNAKYTWPDIEVVLSGTIQCGVLTDCIAIRNGTERFLDSLKLLTEEADVRAMPHALNATEQGNKRIVLITSDTDVMVLGLYFWNRLSEKGLDELWMRAGVGNSLRYIPLHHIADRDKSLCQVLPAAHILTGCDSTSKVGTKLSAIKAHPEKFLTEFGQTLASTPENVFTKAEEYLVQVLKPNCQCKTMDELRYTLHHIGKAMDIQCLPPTTHAIKDHILRCLYASFLQMHCMDLTGTTELDPYMYGYTNDGDGHIIPVHTYKNVPDSIAITCVCKDCSTRRCVCRKSGVSCCKYCKCRNNVLGNVCKNPSIVLSVPVQLK